jgi:hypothetical protein
MNPTLVATCPACRGRRLILRRKTGRSGETYWFACSDCLTQTAPRHTPRDAAETVAWVPVDAPAEE